VELVIVCTPPNTHCELAVKAAEADKHVMVEKPFAMNQEEAHRMVETAARRGRTMTAHQNRRFDGDFLAVRKILETGLLGTVYSIESRKMGYMEGWATWGTPEFLPEWRVQRKYGGGLVYDWGSHLGDQLLQIAPAPVESVYADTQSRVWSKEVDDHFKALIRFTDTSVATLEVSANAQLGLPRWLVCGDKGTLVSQDGKFLLKTREAEYEFPYQPSDRERIHRNLREAIHSGAELLVKPQEILQTVRLLDSIFDSAKIGEVIRW
jgi:predicted dehydrogenase